MTSSTFHLYAPATVKKSAYLVNPVFDMLFVCGGIVLLLSAAYLWRTGFGTSLAQQDTALIAFGLFGTYMLSGPHTGATIVRLYGEKDSRNNFRLVAYVLPVLLTFATVAGLLVPTVAKIEAVLYLVLVIHHYMAQSYGITMMYCARAGLRLSERDKLLPQSILYMAVTVAIAQQFTAELQRQSFLGIPLFRMDLLPSDVVLALQFVLIGLVVALLGQTIMQSKFSPDKVMPLPAVTTLVLTAVLLTVGNRLNDVVWLFLPHLLHSTQYLSVVLAYHLKKDTESAVAEIFDPIERMSSRFIKYFLVGLVFFTGLPIAVSALGFSLTLCNAVVFFGLSFHHFAADACIWKLKNKTVHSRLVS